MLREKAKIQRFQYTLAANKCFAARVEHGAGAESEPDFAFLSRSRSGAGVTINQTIKLGTGLDPESDFKIIFQAIVIVGSKMSNYFFILDMEYQNM